MNTTILPVSPRQVSRKNSAHNPANIITVASANVRYFRHNSRNGWWVVANKNHNGFIRTFDRGLMIDVDFIGNSPLMYCGKENSTGESIGTLKISRDHWSDFEMPQEATYIAPVAYNGTSKFFHIKGTDFRVSKCDFLLLHSDGSAKFGWKNKPENAPELTQMTQN